MGFGVGGGRQFVEPDKAVNEQACVGIQHGYLKLGVFGNGTGAAWLSERIRVFEKVEREAGGGTVWRSLVGCWEREVSTRPAPGESHAGGKQEARRGREKKRRKGEDECQARESWKSSWPMEKPAIAR
jgi:hypothetical protein